MITKSIRNIWPIWASRGWLTIMAIALLYHVLTMSDSFNSGYRLSILILFSLICAIILVSWLHKPWAAYILAVFVIAIPLAMLILLCWLTLNRSHIWEYFLFFGTMMLLPVTIAVYLIKNEPSREYYNLTHRD